MTMQRGSACVCARVRSKFATAPKKKGPSIENTRTSWGRSERPLPCNSARRAFSSICNTSTAEDMRRRNRSEEHTSELRSLMRISYAVFCLKKKKQNDNKHTKNTKDDQTTQRTSTRHIQHVHERLTHNVHRSL